MYEKILSFFAIFETPEAPEILSPSLTDYALAVPLLLPLAMAAWMFYRKERILNEKDLFKITAVFLPFFLFWGFTFFGFHRNLGIIPYIWLIDSLVLVAFWAQYILKRLGIFTDEEE